MKEDSFIEKNRALWSELEQLVTTINKSGVPALQPKEIRRFLYLFQRSSHQLAYARTHFPKGEVVPYLNYLVGQSHKHLYVVPKFSMKDILDYFRYRFPSVVQSNFSYILASFFIFLFGAGLSFILTYLNPDFAYYFLPESMIENLHIGANPTNWSYSIMSSYIMTNNIRVSFMAFVGGILLGLGTLYILFYNGLILGALTGLVYTSQDILAYWSLILPHGFIELTAIFISGGAGLMIGGALLIPRKFTRKDALIYMAKQASALIPGIVFLLVIAGIIEGFFTPLPISPWIKLGGAALTALWLCVYLGKKSKHKEQS